MVVGNKGAVYTIEKTDRKMIIDNFIEIKRILVSYRQQITSFEDTIKALEAYGIKYAES